MTDRVTATLTIWSALPVPGCLAEQLRKLGVDLHRGTITEGAMTASRTRDGLLLLKLRFQHEAIRAADLEAALATARLTDSSYITLHAEPGASFIHGRCYDAGAKRERRFVVTTDGALTFMPDQPGAPRNGRPAGTPTRPRLRLNAALHSPRLAQPLDPSSITTTGCCAACAPSGGCFCGY